MHYISVNAKGGTEEQIKMIVGKVEHASAQLDCKNAMIY